MCLVYHFRYVRHILLTLLSVSVLFSSRTEYYCLYMQHHTAKHFVLQLGSLISLYTSLISFLVLTFGFINLLFPDALNSSWEVESAASSIRIGFAMVLVFFPTYIVLTRLVNTNRRASKDSSYLGLTKWLIYLSLLVSGLVLLGDLVAIIMGFLEGELTSRFILKAAAVFLVTGGAFYYYILDARGYWLKNEKKSVVYGVGMSMIIIIILIAALLQVPNPAQVREQKVDAEMISALQDMQYRVEDYYRTNKTLPEDLSTLFGEFPVPSAPENKPAYGYEVTGETTYNLCADFTRSSNDQLGAAAQDRIMLAPGYPGIGNYNWDYKSGNWCFKRVIDEEYRK